MSTDHKAGRQLDGESSGPTSQATVSGRHEGKTVAIVGSGPAGLCSALLLAKKGWQVEIFERRAHPKDDAVTNKQRSIIIALMKRGTASLEQAGFELPSKAKRELWKNNVAICKGVMIHSKDGKTIPRNTNLQLWITERDALNEALTEFALTTERIKIHYKVQVQKIDFSARALNYTEAGEHSSFSYDLLLGCDGRNSVVREMLSEEIPSVKFEAKHASRSWKSFTGLSREDVTLDGDTEGGLFFHNFASGAARLAVWPTRFGTISGYLTQPTPFFTDENNTVEAYKSLIKSAAPSYPEAWLEKTVHQLVDSPLGHVGTAWCSTSCGPSTVLLGDAANAVTPLLGQGVNSALESCRIFVEELERQEDIDAACQAYSDRRHPDLHALSLLDKEGLERIGAKGPFTLRFISFNLMQNVVCHPSFFDS